MRFGKNTSEVERFVTWYDGLAVDDVEAIVAGSLDSTWLRTMPVIGRRVGEAGLSAPVRSAILATEIQLNSAKATAGLDLGSATSRLGIALNRTLQALAIREKVSAEDFALVTKGFREAGYDFDAGVVTGSGL